MGADEGEEVLVDALHPAVQQGETLEVVGGRRVLGGNGHLREVEGFRF